MNSHQSPESNVTEHVTNGMVPLLAVGSVNGTSTAARLYGSVEGAQSTRATEPANVGTLQQLPLQPPGGVSPSATYRTFYRVENDEMGRPYYVQTSPTVLVDGKGSQSRGQNQQPQKTLPADTRQQGMHSQFAGWLPFSELLDQLSAEGWQEEILFLDALWSAHAEKAELDENAECNGRQQMVGLMSYKQFEAALTKISAVLPLKFKRRGVFTTLDRDGDGILKRQEFLSGLLALSPRLVERIFEWKQSVPPRLLYMPSKDLGDVMFDFADVQTRMRLQWIFVHYDIDSDGFLSEEELTNLLCHLAFLREWQQRTSTPSLPKYVPETGAVLRGNDVVDYAEIADDPTRYNPYAVKREAKKEEAGPSVLDSLSVKKDEPFPESWNILTSSIPCPPCLTCWHRNEIEPQKELMREDSIPVTAPRHDVLPQPDSVISESTLPETKAQPSVADDARQLETAEPSRPTKLVRHIGVTAELEKQQRKLVQLTKETVEKLSMLPTARSSASPVTSSPKIAVAAESIHSVPSRALSEIHGDEVPLRPPPNLESCDGRSVRYLYDEYGRWHYVGDSQMPSHFELSRIPRPHRPRNFPVPPSDVRDARNVQRLQERRPEDRLEDVVARANRGPTIADLPHPSTPPPSVKGVTVATSPSVSISVPSIDMGAATSYPSYASLDVTRTSSSPVVYPSWNHAVEELREIRSRSSLDTNFFWVDEPSRIFQQEGNHLAPKPKEFDNEITTKGHAVYDGVSAQRCPTPICGNEAHEDTGGHQFLHSECSYVGLAPFDDARLDVINELVERQARRQEIQRLTEHRAVQGPNARRLLKAFNNQFGYNAFCQCVVLGWISGTTLLFRSEACAATLLATADDKRREEQGLRQVKCEQAAEEYQRENLRKQEELRYRETILQREEWKRSASQPSGFCTTLRPLMSPGPALSACCKQPYVEESRHSNLHRTNRDLCEDHVDRCHRCGGVRLPETANQDSVTDHSTSNTTMETNLSASPGEVSFLSVGHPQVLSCEDLHMQQLHSELEAPTNYSESDSILHEIPSSKSLKATTVVESIEREDTLNTSSQQKHSNQTNENHPDKETSLQLGLNSGRSSHPDSVFAVKDVDTSRDGDHDRDHCEMLTSTDPEITVGQTDAQISSPLRLHGFRVVTSDELTTSSCIGLGDSPVKEDHLLQESGAKDDLVMTSSQSVHESLWHAPLDYSMKNLDEDTPDSDSDIREYSSTPSDHIRKPSSHEVAKQLTGVVEYARPLDEAAQCESASLEFEPPFSHSPQERQLFSIAALPLVTNSPLTPSRTGVFCYANETQDSNKNKADSELLSFTSIFPPKEYPTFHNLRSIQNLFQDLMNQKSYPTIKELDQILNMLVAILREENTVIWSTSTPLEHEKRPTFDLLVCGEQVDARLLLTQSNYVHEMENNKIRLVVFLGFDASESSYLSFVMWLALKVLYPPGIHLLRPDTTALTKELSSYFEHRCATPVEKERILEKVSDFVEYLPAVVFHDNLLIESDFLASQVNLSQDLLLSLLCGENSNKPFRKIMTTGDEPGFTSKNAESRVNAALGFSQVVSSGLSLGRCHTKVSPASIIIILPSQIKHEFTLPLSPSRNAASPISTAGQSSDTVELRIRRDNWERSTSWLPSSPERSNRNGRAEEGSQPSSETLELCLLPHSSGQGEYEQTVVADEPQTPSLLPYFTKTTVAPVQLTHVSPPSSPPSIQSPLLPETSTVQDNGESEIQKFMGIIA